MSSDTYILLGETKSLLEECRRLHSLLATKQDLKELEKNIMATQADLDAAIAALPGQIEASVETALQPVIAAIQASAAANNIDLSSEIASLNAIPGTVSQKIATDLTPAAPAAPATP